MNDIPISSLTLKLRKYSVQRHQYLFQSPPFEAATRSKLEKEPRQFEYYFSLSLKIAVFKINNFDTNNVTFVSILSYHQTPKQLLYSFFPLA